MENKMTFEQALERLEAIAEQLEQGSVPLDESLKLYEEGSKLAAVCNATLKNAQQKITELSAADGEE